MNITNLVLGGGGVAALNMYGAIKNMVEKEFLDFNKIEKSVEKYRIFDLLT